MSGRSDPSPTDLRDAKVLEISAAVELSDRSGCSGPQQKVDTRYGVSFVRRDGVRETWHTHLWRDLDVDLREGPIEEQFDFIARSAAEVLEYEMAQSGYRGHAARDQLPIEWSVGRLLQAHPDRIRIEP
jgi:hypothetical protein